MPELTDTEKNLQVLVELSSIFKGELVKDPNLHVKFVGLDTERPIVQLGTQVHSSSTFLMCFGP